MNSIFSLPFSNTVPLWRGMRVLALVRVFLIVMIVFSVWFSDSISINGVGAKFVAISYLFFSIVLMFLVYAKIIHYVVLLLLGLSFDISHITALLFVSDLTRFSFSSLYFLPVVGAALLAPQIIALGVAAAATLALLSMSWFQYMGARDDAALFQVASLGTGLLISAWVLNKIARRIIVQDILVEEQKRHLELQVLMNRAVVRELDRGVLAISSDGNVQLLNAQAAYLLGLDENVANVRAVLARENSGFLLQLDAWRSALSNTWSAYFDFPFKKTASNARHEQVFRYLRARPLGTSSLGTSSLEPELKELLVIIEDLRELEGRATQLKLASMGRLTASIAHEIRNPLAAISHAAALMADELGKEIRLVRIVEENTYRINRIIEDVLSVSRSGRARPESIVLVDMVTMVVEEIGRGQPVQAARMQIEIPKNLMVWFDRAQLQQILVNLLVNADRYASHSASAIKIVMRETRETYGELNIEDDGPGLSREAKEHLFEPFFTTHSKGTGLGLYLARELALANAADLWAADHPLPQSGAIFTLKMKLSPAYLN